MNDWQRLDELLERGLDFYGRQLVSEAIQCWREVLYLSPGHQLALEYLEAAGASPEEAYQPTPMTKRTSAAMTAQSPEPGAEEPPLTLESLSVLAVELIRERRLEDALALLYTAHGEAPKDQSISRSINVIKQRLTREYRAEIGDLGQIPHLTVDEALIDELDLTEDEREVLRLIDGIVALDDVVQTSGFALLQIYRALAQLLRRNLIVLKTAVAEPAKATRVEEGPRTKTAPFRPQLVPPAPPVATTTPAATGPKLVALPPLPEPPPDAMKQAAKAPPGATGQPVPPTPIGFSAAPAAPIAKEPTASTALPISPAPSGNSTSTAMPIPVMPANTAPVVAPLPASALSFNVGPLAAAATAVSVKTAAAATAAANAASAAASAAANAAANAAPNAPLDVTDSGAATADSPPRRPSPYAAHVAEAVRAHLQGKHTRAKELLAMCVAECPDEPAARRNLQRLKERLGVKE